MHCPRLLRRNTQKAPPRQLVSACYEEQFLENAYDSGVLTQRRGIGSAMILTRLSLLRCGIGGLRGFPERHGEFPAIFRAAPRLMADRKNRVLRRIPVH